MVLNFFGKWFVISALRYAQRSSAIVTSAPMPGHSTLCLRKRTLGAAAACFVSGTHVDYISIYYSLSSLKVKSRHRGAQPTVVKSSVIVRNARSANAFWSLVIWAWLAAAPRPKTAARARYWRFRLFMVGCIMSDGGHVSTMAIYGQKLPLHAIAQGSAKEPHRP